MHLDGSYTFKAPRELVWRTLQSPATIEACMPGCERFVEIGTDQYEATMKLGIGPIRGVYTGRITLRDREEPTQYQMDVEGGGAPGHMKGNGLIRLEERGDETVVTYVGDAHITGKIASVGQRLLGASAKQLVNQFFKCMDRNLLEGPVSGVQRPVSGTDTPTAGAS